MEYFVRRWQFGFIFLLVLFKETIQLKDFSIKVPPAVVRGQDAILQCFFDLEGDKLYSVKWYRSGWEFYRYTPNERPPIKQFKIFGLPNLSVRLEESKDKQIVLGEVQRNISGTYSCEVTADQPSFFTAIQTAELKVVDLPKKDPYITGLKSRYRPGDMLKANCTSEDSNPAANLTWYVNNIAFNDHHVHRHRHESNSFTTAQSTLRLLVSKKLFENGRLKIRCSATMYTLYHRSSEKSVELDKKKHRGSFDTTTLPAYQHWELAQAERHPETTLIFNSPPVNSLSSTSTGSLAIYQNLHQRRQSSHFLHLLLYKVLPALFNTFIFTLTR